MFKKIIFLLMIMMLFVSSPIVSHAVNYSLPYQEPSTSDGQGYIALELQNRSTGAKIINVFAWAIQYNSNPITTCGMSISLTDSSIKFQVNNEAEEYVNCALAYYTSSNLVRVVHSDYTNTWSYSYDYSSDGPGFKIVGYQFKGNVTEFMEDNSIYSFDIPSLSFGSDTSLINIMLDITQDLNNLNNSVGGKLDDLISKIESMVYEFDYVEEYLITISNYIEYYLPSMDYELESIDDELDRIYAKIDALLEEQKESNTWLEKIFNFLEEKDEKDKQAAIQQGNQSTSDVDNIVQDDSEGFKDSLGGLTSSMSYAGTECSWTFPTVKLPAIAGVMDEVTLVDSKEIDFTYWVSSLPAGILLLVQSVCTAALIVFCFKELYGAISYVLTLKGGGNSE